MESSGGDVFLPKHRLWKRNIEKLLFKNNICGVCLSEEHELNQLDTIYFVEKGSTEKSLQDIIDVTFGQVSRLLPTKYICEACVPIILQSFLLLKKIKLHQFILQKYIDILTQQASISSETEQPIEKQLFLTIDNVNSLTVPSTVTVSNKQSDSSITQIFLCELDPLDSEHENENLHLKYECPYCGKQFYDFVLFRNHYNQHKELYFRCHKCSKRFKVLNELIEHRYLKHSDKVTVCEICQIILLSPLSTEHEKEHPIDFNCAVSQTTFQLQSELDTHNAENHAYATCQKCLKTFNSSKIDQHRCRYKCSECKDECLHEDFLASYRDQHILQTSSVFICPLCDFMYTSKCQIISHANEQHLSHFPYLCDICGQNFPSKPNLRLHVSKNHAESNVLNENSVALNRAVLPDENCLYACNLCKLHFDSDSAYADHRRKHLTQCQFCEKSFSNIGQLNAHIKTDHTGDVSNEYVDYSCSMCSSDFMSRAEYLEHISTHPKGTNHLCRQCNESFTSKALYISHTRRHKILYNKECPICLKKYTKHTISRHMELHLVIPNWDENSKLMCDICAALLPNETTLIKHSAKHNEQRQCPHCQVFVNSVLYSKHISTHVETEKQQRSCTECDYTTKFPICLEAHINRHHLKLRPYRCDLCNKTFYSDYTLKGHMATHKAIRPEHYCLICSKKFISKKALIFHTRIHTGEAPYSCDLCDLRFLSSSRRRQHMIRNHYEPQFECQECFKKLFTQSDLKRHIENCHGETKRKRVKTSEIGNGR